MLVVTEGGTAQERRQNQDQNHTEQSGKQGNPVKGHDGSGYPLLIISPGSLSDLTHSAGIDAKTRNGTYQ